MPNLSKVASDSSKYLFIASTLTADLVLLTLDAALFDNQFLFTKFEIQLSLGVLFLKHFETIPKDINTEN